jgi:hypothetical protein
LARPFGAAAHLDFAVAAADLHHVQVPLLALSAKSTPPLHVSRRRERLIRKAPVARMKNSHGGAPRILLECRRVGESPLAERPAFLALKTDDHTQPLPVYPQCPVLQSAGPILLLVVVVVLVLDPLGEPASGCRRPSSSLSILDRAWGHARPSALTSIEKSPPNTCCHLDPSGSASVLSTETDNRQLTVLRASSSSGHRRGLVRESLNFHNQRHPPLFSRCNRLYSPLGQSP